MLLILCGTAYWQGYSTARLCDAEKRDYRRSFCGDSWIAGTCR